MSIVVLQTFTAAEGQYDKLACTISQMLPGTAARTGAEFIKAAGNPAEGVITVYEQWDGPDNLQAYVSWRMSQPDAAAMISLLKEPPKIQQLAHLF